MPDTMDLEAGGHNYRLHKMDVIKAFHVNRRLGPIITQISGLLVGMAAPAAPGGPAVDPNSIPVSAVLKMDISKFAPVANALADLSDEHMNYILAGTLSVTTRALGHDMGWAPVWSPQANALMFADISMPDMLKLVAGVIFFNLQGFMPAAFSPLAADGATTSPRV